MSETTRRAALAAGLLSMAVVVTACGGSGGSKSVSLGPLQRPASLTGVVGQHDAFSISLTDPQGHPIRHLAAGTYPLTVRDESTLHNFHLTGPGVDKSTPIGSTVTANYTITFTPGTYSFVCDPHAGQMHGKFTVT